MGNERPKQTNTSEDWRVLAGRDMSVAEYLAATMRPVPAEIVAFHCQQAAEKYLKGALVILGIEPPYIHDLPELCKLAEKRRSAFAGISSSCTVITHFAVQPRYDRGLDISGEDMRLVLQHARIIKDFLTAEIPELFQEIAPSTGR